MLSNKAKKFLKDTNRSQSELDYLSQRLEDLGKWKDYEWNNKNK